MTIYRLTAPNDTTTIIGNRHEPAERVRIILGVGYTDRVSIAEWATEHGYTVDTVSKVPTSHLDRAARLNAWPGEPSFNVDGADPASAYRFTGPDGHTQYDIRDVINGVVTA